MMLSPVSMAGVQFRGAQATSAADILNRPGAFTKPETTVAPDATPKKKGGALKKTLAVVGGLLATAAALITLNKTGALKVLDPAVLADSKWYQKAGHYVSKAGEFLAKYSIDPLMNLFKKAPKTGEEVAEALSTIV